MPAASKLKTLVGSKMKNYIHLCCCMCNTPWICCKFQCALNKTVHRLRFLAHPSKHSFWSNATLRELGKILMKIMGKKDWNVCRMSIPYLFVESSGTSLLVHRGDALWTRLVCNLLLIECCCQRDPRILDLNLICTPST